MAGVDPVTPPVELTIVVVVSSTRVIPVLQANAFIVTQPSRENGPNSHASGCGLGFVT